MQDPTCLVIFNIKKKIIHKFIPTEFHSSANGSQSRQRRQLPGSGGSTEVLELAIDTGSVVEKQLELPKDKELMPTTCKSVVLKWNISPI